MADPIPALYAIAALAGLVAAFFWMDVARNAKGERSPLKLGDAATFTAVSMAFASGWFLLSLLSRL